MNKPTVLAALLLFCLLITVTQVTSADAAASPISARSQAKARLELRLKARLLRRTASSSSSVSSAQRRGSSSSVRISSSSTSSKSLSSSKASVSSSAASVSSSASSYGFGVDPLPLIPPHQAFLVYGNVTDVMDICPLAGDMTQKKIASYFGKFDSVSELMIYDKASQKQIARGVRALGLHGELAFSESTGALLPVELPVRDYYFRMKLVGADPALPSESVLQVGGTCIPAAKGNYFLVPAAITDIVRSGAENAPLVSGNHVTIGSFIVKGRKASDDQTLQLKSIGFLALPSANVHLSNIKLKADGAVSEVECLTNDMPNISCESLSEDAGNLSGDRTYTVYADVLRIGQSGSVQLQITDFGDRFHAGSVQWKNRFETYQWLLPSEKTVKGTMYQG